MRVLLEDWVPYPRSILWKLHHRYFATRGTDAWTKGEIPSLATSSYPIARQHARLLCALADDLAATRRLGRKAPFVVLEVGSGAGRFAENVIRALMNGTGARGRALLARLRYVLSDYSAKNVREATASGTLGELTRAGLVIPALFDVTRPDELSDLDGRPLRLRFAAVLANYVCCVTPPVVASKSPEGYFERRVKVEQELPDGSRPARARAKALRALESGAAGQVVKDLAVSYDWAPATLEGLLPDALHRETARELLEPFAAATLTYPVAFLELARRLRERVIPGGLLLVNDYGSCERRDLGAPVEQRPTVYGDTLNHGVNFSVFDVFCRRAGLALVRSRAPLGAVHSAAIRYARAVSPGFRRAFRKLYVRRHDGQDHLDLRDAASVQLAAKSFGAAARLLEQCLRLDPGSTVLLLRAGEAHVEAGAPRRALRFLRRGEALDVAKEHDFAFAIGRALVKLERPRAALRAFERSLARGESVALHANRALAFEKVGELKSAYLAYRRAIDLDPEAESARLLMRRVIDQFLPEAYAADVVEEERPAPQAGGARDGR